MKYILVLFAAVLITYACQQVKTHNTTGRLEHTRIIWDTSEQTNYIPNTKAVRFIIDTFKIVITDSSDGKLISEKRWVSDTSYAVPFQDSIRNEKGKIIYDSLHKTWLAWYLKPIKKETVVQDLNKSWR